MPIQEFPQPDRSAPLQSTPGLIKHLSGTPRSGFVQRPIVQQAWERLDREFAWAIALRKKSDDELIRPRPTQRGHRDRHEAAIELNFGHAYLS